MTEIRGESSRITDIKIPIIDYNQDSNHQAFFGPVADIRLFYCLRLSNSRTSATGPKNALKCVGTFDYNKDLHLQESRSSQAGQRARSVLQARVITLDFSGNPKKRNPQIQTKTSKQLTNPMSPCRQVLQARHPPVLYHQAADVLHRHHSSGHNHQSTMTHMTLGV